MKTEAQRDYITCPQVQNRLAAGPWFNPAAWLQSTWVSLPGYAILYLLVGLKHTPIFFFLNVFIASNHMYNVQYIRNLEKGNEDWIFLGIKSKILWQFCRSETIRVTGCVYFSDSSHYLQSCLLIIMYVCFCWQARLALGTWLLPQWRAPLWKTQQKYKPLYGITFTGNRKATVPRIWSTDWYIINWDWSAICCELVTLWTIRDKFFTCVWFSLHTAQWLHAINWRIFHAWS